MHTCTYAYTYINLLAHIRISVCMYVVYLCNPICTFLQKRDKLKGEIELNSVRAVETVADNAFGSPAFQVSV